MSDRMYPVTPPALETLEDRVLFSASSLAEAPDVAPAAGPEISVARSGVAINDNQASTVFFPATLEGTTASTAVFVITNDGTSTLNLGRITVPAGYIMVNRPPASLAAGESGSLRVRLDTTTPGTYTGQITIINNDSDENPFNFAVSGRVIDGDAPQDIDVFAGGPKINPGDTAPVNLGQVEVGGTKTFTFRVRNDGGQNLTISNLQVPAGFTVTNGLVSTLGSGDQDTFTISVDTSSAGIKSGNIVITTNDPNPAERNFRFAVSATVGDAQPDPTIEPDSFEGATGDNTANFSRFHFNNDRYRFHTIHNSGDVDWIRFYVPQTSYIAVRAIHGVASQPGIDPAGDLRLQLYGPKAVNNSDGIELTAPAWNATAVPQPDRPQDTILVRAGFRALTQGWYWMKADGMNNATIEQYGIRVYIRALATDVASQVESVQAAAAPSGAALAAFAKSGSTTDDQSTDEGEDSLLEVEPVLSFLA